VGQHQNSLGHRKVIADAIPASRRNFGKKKVIARIDLFQRVSGKTGPFRKRKSDTDYSSMQFLRLSCLEDSLSEVSGPAGNSTEKMQGGRSFRSLATQIRVHLKKIIKKGMEIMNLRAKTRMK
jgi:hypothetical protein